MSKRTNKISTSQDVYNAVERFFKNNPLKSFTTSAVINSFGKKFKKNFRIVVINTLKQLKERGVITEEVVGEYKLDTSKLKKVVGTVVTITKGAAYIDAKELEEDVIVERGDLANALIGDVVEIVITEGRNGRFNGMVTSVIKRSDKRYVGEIRISDSFAFVVTSAREMPYDIFIPKREIASGVNDGDKVVVEIVEFKPSQPNPVGRVLRSLGKPGNNDTEMHAILEEYSLPYMFTKEVIDASENIPDTISQKDLAKRRDFRDTLTFTIDPFDAKDFDDALSFKKIDENRYEIGVHIADVTHYIKEHSVLDVEALDRATSVYLVDRVVPMLPERLSNGLCSLRPNEDKLCFSVLFTMDNEATILDKWFGRTIINSDRRFAYEEVQEIIEAKEGEHKEAVLMLNDLAQKMRAARYKHGSIAFDREEPKFKLDENGKPLGVYFKRQKEANQLIEEFMLSANRAVAEFVALSNKPDRTFVYRIHSEPDPDKYNNFCRFAGKFGYHVKMTSNNREISQELNKLLQNIKGKKVENLFSTLALRSMAKAVYSTTNVGHYGLAFDNYTHFTSPIRRYPDVMVHRLLQRYLDNEPSASKEYYEDLCDHSSKREIRATEAERASIKYKMVEFLSDKIGVEFFGTISGVTDKGIYVELEETKIEGMVSLFTLTDDFYDFDEENYRLVGRKTGVKMMLGDRVKVSVAKVDFSRKLIDYNLVSHFDFDTDGETTFL